MLLRTIDLGDHPSPFWQEKSRALTTVMMWLRLGLEPCANHLEYVVHFDVFLLSTLQWFSSRLSDFSTWPFTQRFCSVPELLEGHEEGTKEYSYHNNCNHLV